MTVGGNDGDSGERSLKLFYRFESETEPAMPMRLKIEMNTNGVWEATSYEDNDSIELQAIPGKSVNVTMDDIYEDAGPP